MKRISLLLVLILTSLLGGSVNKFVSQPLDKLMNRQNVVSRIEKLEAKTGPQPSATIGNLSELSPDAGDQYAGTYYVVDQATGVIRGYFTATPNEQFPGYYLAFFDSAGVFQFGVNADDGSAVAGAGAVILDKNGVALPDAGDALTLSDSLWNTHTHLFMSNGYLNLVNFRVQSETSLITNGNFETGDTTGWTVTDPSGKIAIESDGKGYYCTFTNAAVATERISQSASHATNGCVVSFRAKSTDNCVITVWDSSGTNTEALYTYSEWRNYIVIFNNPGADVYLGFACPGEEGFVDDIVVRELVGTYHPLKLRVDTAGTMSFEGAAFFNSASKDRDFRVSALSTVGGLGNPAFLFFTDASTGRIGIRKQSPAYELDISGDANLDTGCSYRINGTVVLSGTVTGVTNGDSHDHNGGDGAAIVEAAITLADNTTNDVSTTKHGFAPKAPNDATKYLDGTGAYTVPAGSGGLTNTNVSPTTADITLEVNKRFFVDASGLTADRALKFPTGSAGDQIEIRMIGESASYACKLQGDTGINLEGLTATEWDRLWHSGMALSFVYRATDGWRLLQDNRHGFWRRILLASDAQPITFANIPNIYNTLRFKVSARSVLAAVTYDTLQLALNGLAGTNYESAIYYWFNNAGTPTFGTTTTTGAALTQLAYIPAATAPTSSFGGGWLEIEDYANTNKFKRIHWRGGMHVLGGAAYNASSSRIYDHMGEVKTTNAITQAVFSLPAGTNFLAQSEITLYCER